MKKGCRIKTVEQLAVAAAERRSVIVSCWRGRMPAVVVMNMQAAQVVKMLESGIYLNIPKKRIDLSKPPRKWIPYKPDPAPKPILNLPYYPEQPTL